MDKIILTSANVETLLKWRDNNTEYIRRNAAPFKGIMLEFPETKIIIKAINDGQRITFYIRINGANVGKITGQQIPGGFFKAIKNTTKLKSDDVQSIITVYASLMALIVYYKPEKAPETKTRKEAQKPSGKHQRKSGITYIFQSGGSFPRLAPKGTHASPAQPFSVRGHYRHYKNGHTVWIAPYRKGEGKTKNKTYKL